MSNQDYNALEPSVRNHLARPPAAPVVHKILGAEGGVDASGNALTNPKSTAHGKSQMVEGTWLEQYRKRFGDTGEDKETILAKRGDAALSTTMAAQYVNEIKSTLRSASHEPSDTNVSLAYFLGPTGAINTLSAPRTARIEDVVSPKTMKSNPHLRGMSVQDVIQWARDRLNKKR